MKYKIIEKMQRPNGTICKYFGIGIGKQNITFRRGFIEKYGMKHNYVMFAENEEGYLCFSFCEEAAVNTYHINKSSIGACFLRTPSSLLARVEKGKYSVTKNGKWFVSSCKLKS